MWTLLLLQAALAAPVTFQVNDALVKDRPVDAVAVRAATGDGAPRSLGVTDASGRLVVDLEPGTWLLSYARAGYVPIPDSPTPIPSEGAIITTTLSPLLEAGDDAGHRRVQIVLNWGSEWSDVPDADAHLVCPDGTETYFGQKEHEGADGHAARLDVDDVDWGGPETITLVDPTPGRYRYFVRNFTGRGHPLGASDVVVRVVLDDAVAGEFRVPTDLTDQDWMPFEALVVEEDGRSRVQPFAPEALAAGADRRSGAGFRMGASVGTFCMAAVLLPVLSSVAMLVVGYLRRGVRRARRP